MGCQNQCNTNSCNLPKYFENEIHTFPDKSKSKSNSENIMNDITISHAKTCLKEIPINEY